MKKKSQTNKGIVIGILLLFIISSIIPSIRGLDDVNRHSFDKNPKITFDEITSINNETEYWALLVAVGVYAGHPDEDRPHMLGDVENLREKLLVSTHWKEENIKVIKGKEATLFNIIKGFRWLDRIDDKDDFSLVYITTHGFPLSFDIPPFDEEDKTDEALISYRGFRNPFAIIWDDLLNLLLSLLNSKGVCVVIDSCYAGGFNDPPYFNKRMKNVEMNVNEWVHEFAEELSESGRVVLMSCSEDEVSYGPVFTPLLVKGLTGYADANEDDMVSAEEVFDYVEENIDPGFGMHPTMYDGFTGELQITEVEFPPSKPVSPTGQVLGNTNTTYNYSTVSTDPESGQISYGWDWDGDYAIDEWTDPIDSGTWVNTSHSWAIEGTYTIRVKAKDERGLSSSWSNIVVMMCSDNIPDQRQTKIEKGGSAYFRNYWLAQSFVPSLYTLSKVDLEICCVIDPKPLHLSIRDSLSGDNLTEISRVVPYVGSHETTWYTFDFDDIDVTPGKTYFIVCKGVNNCSYLWKGKNGNPYPPGMSYGSIDGNSWDGDSSRDFCFVTWANVKYPIVFDPIPEDGDLWVSSNISQLSFNLKDYQGDLMDYTVETVPDIGAGSGNNVGDGKYSIDVSNIDYENDYYWFVNVTDGEHWNNKVFYFKTQPKMVFDPFDEGWQYRKKITIDHDKVAGNLTDFSVLISVVDDDLKNKAQGDGDDILFMDSFGVANRLLHEIESFDGSSGELAAWINVTNLSSSTDTVLYMYYGNSDCDSQEYPDHVWDSDYCGVWHLNDFLDSTRNDNDGINYGTDNCTGKIGNAKDFVETNNDYVSLGDMPEPADGSISKGTFEVWINPDELAGRSIICKLDTKLEPDRKSYYFGLMNTGQLQFSVHSGTWYPEGRNIRAITDAGHIITGTWQHVVVVVDLSTEDIAFFYNGEEIDVNITTVGTPPSHFYDINLDEWLGRYSPESSGPYFYDGLMDEVRISKTCRSADWILTQYNNQNDPSSFLVVGPEES